MTLSVTIVGDVPGADADGQKIKQELHALADRSGFAGCVRFTGFVPLHETRRLLSEHNVFMCPSKRAANGDAEGGSPVALTEAMASGLVCVGTRHCDIPEVILSDETGRLCDEGDVEAMADALTDLAGNDEDAARFTEAGRRHVAQNFSLPIQMAKLGDIYRSFLPGLRSGVGDAC